MEAISQKPSLDKNVNTNEATEPSDISTHDLLAPQIDWSNMGEREHFAQFYENDESLIHNVCDFVSASLKKGNGGIVIATETHRKGIERKLAEQGINLHSAMEGGQLICLDAAETLAKFMKDGTPHPARFQKTVGSLVSKVAHKFGHLHAFGEMVALLWQDGNREAAIKLEELWNELGKSHNFALYCAYPLKAVADAKHDVPFDHVCSAHSRVIPMESYSHLRSQDVRLREVLQLQRKAAILEAEIARRVEIEKFLHESKRELKDFLEHAAEGIHKVGKDGTILWANKAELNLLGYSPEEYIGHNITEFHADAEVIADILTRLKKGETLKDYKARLNTKHGTIKHVLINSNVQWEDGEFVHTRCFTRDITERTETEKVQAFLAAIVQSSEDAIISKNVEGRILSWNPAAERVFGYTEDEAIGKSITMLIPSDRLHEEDDILSRMLRGERIEHFETVRVAKDGKCIDMALTISPLRDGRGKIIGGSKIARDITERVRLRRERLEAEERVRKSEARLHEELERMNELYDLSVKLATATTLQSALDEILKAAICILKSDFGNIQIVNAEKTALEISAQQGFKPEFLEHFKIVPLKEASSICGRASQSVKRVWIDDVEIDPIFAEHIAVARAVPFRAVQSTPIVNKSGKLLGMISTHWKEPTSPSDHNLHQFDLYLFQAAALLERLYTEQELLQSREEVKEADRRKDEFLATLAHELRNPLAPISNGLHILQAPQAKEEIKEQARNMMHRQVRQMQRLIDDLMDVARINQKKIELRKQPITINDVIQNAIEIAKPMLTEKRHDLRITQSHEALTIDGDMVRLSQVFANLLNNSAKYSDEGASIQLTARREGSEAAISVKDNGVGIPPNMLTKIFDMFTQIDNTLERAQGGLGIGLTLVKELVALHGGRIAAYSDGKGKGSEFTVYLPTAEQGQNSLNEVPRIEKPIHSYRVLVIDDNEASAKTLGWTLEVIGHEFALAHDLHGAMQMVDQFKPEVILLDIGMPGTNGYDICKLLRQNPDAKDALIIAQTGWGQQEHRIRSQEAGFDHHLVKPIEMEILQQLLSHRQRC